MECGPYPRGLCPCLVRIIMVVTIYYVLLMHSNTHGMLKKTHTHTWHASSLWKRERERVRDRGTIAWKLKRIEQNNKS